MKVRELLTSEEKWTQGVAARDESGRPCGQSVAYKRCLVAALYYCYPTQQARLIETRIKERLFGGRLGDCLSVWNDSPWRTFEEVRQLIHELNI